MQQLKNKYNKVAYEFLEPATMKFKPQKLINSTNQHWKNKLNHKIQCEANSSQKDTHQTQIKRLKYLERITAQYIIIGNQYQIDMISMGNQTKLYLDTQFYWSLSISSNILNICVDPQNNYIYLSSDTQTFAYQYNLKILSQFPRLINKIKFKQNILYTRIPKQSLIAIFFQDHIQIYENMHGSLRKVFESKYGIKINMRLFYVANPLQQSISIFFLQQFNDLCSLEYIELKITSLNIIMTECSKIYDIKNSKIKDLKIEKYSRDIFIMNLGNTLFIVKNGYVIDNVYVNINYLDYQLRYIGNDRLLHITSKKVDVYNFFADKQQKVPKICFNPLDSIIFKKDSNKQFLGSMFLSQGNFALFYQQSQKSNKRSNGEVLYYIYLTNTSTIEKKIKKIFSIQNMKMIIKDENYLLESYDSAYKMGLTSKQIYLQMWNRTFKSNDQQYAFLFATEDYQTIKNQLYKKLKKKALSYKQIYKIQAKCLQILAPRMLNPYFDLKTIIQYTSCHFFKRKIQLFKDLYQIQRSQGKISRSESEQKQLSKKQFKRSYSQIGKINLTDESNISIQNTIKITIQQYNKLAQMNIKQQIIELVHQFCFQHKNTIKKIRIILTSFKLVFIVHYEELLQQIIKTAKFQLLRLLIKMPQLLPFNSKNNSTQLTQSGIWHDLIQQQWKEALCKSYFHHDKERFMQEFINSVWFKRNWLVKHDLIKKTKQQIQLHHQKIRKSYIFYFFISKIFQNFPIKESQHLQSPELIKINVTTPVNKKSNIMIFPKKTQVENDDQLLLKVDPKKGNKFFINCIVQLLQARYQQMPKHLRCKIFLYFNIFMYLSSKNMLPENKNTFTQFLNLQGSQLFQHFFKKEKNEKGLLLKGIKPIYQQIKQIGIQLFNQGLSQYFKSNKSQVSDLKYILNRINNQKKQFHDKNKKMYKILVEAILIKLKVGSENDIPIDEVLIYIQSISLEEQNFQKQIKFIEQIKNQADCFRKMKLDMSLQDIMKGHQEVIKKIVLYQMQQNKIKQPNITIQQFKSKTKTVLFNVDSRKSKLFHEKSFYLPFYELLFQLLQQTDKITYCIQLLNDYDLSDKYNITPQTKEQIVYYMYQVRFLKYPCYIDNQSYISQLLKILEPDNQWKQFIEKQMQISIALTSKQYKVQFPIGCAGSPNYQQFRFIVSNLKSQHILTLNINKIYQCILYMDKAIREVVIPLKVRHQGNNKSINLQQIYQVLILRLLQLGQLKKLPIILKPLLQTSKNPYIIIYPIIYIEQIINSNKLNVDCCYLLAQCILYYFKNPLKLLSIIQKMINSHFRTDERKQFLIISIKEGKRMHLGFDKSNKLFSKQFISYMKQKLENVKGFDFQNLTESIRFKQFGGDINLVICSIMVNLGKDRDWFAKKIVYRIIIEILCNQPYVLGKYLSLKLQNINLKSIRLFFSYLSSQLIFEPIKLFQFCNRIFLAIYESVTNNKSLQKVLDQIKNMNIENSDQVIELNQNYDNKNYILQTANAFRNKKQFLLSKKERNQQIINPFITITILQNKNARYEFQDSDNQYYEDNPKKIKQNTIKQVRKQFNPKQQMKNILKKKESVQPQKGSAESHQFIHKSSNSDQNFYKVSQSTRVHAHGGLTGFRHNYINRKNNQTLGNNLINQKKNLTVQYQQNREEDIKNKKQNGIDQKDKNNQKSTTVNLLKPEQQCHSIMVSEDSQMIRQSSIGMPSPIVFQSHLDYKFQNKFSKQNSMTDNKVISNQKIQNQDQNLRFSFNKTKKNCLTNQIKRTLDFRRTQSQMMDQQKKNQFEKESLSSVDSPFFNKKQQEKNSSLFKVFSTINQNQKIGSKLSFPPSIKQNKIPVTIQKCEKSFLMYDSIQNSKIKLRQHTDNKEQNDQTQQQQHLKKLLQELISNNEQFLKSNIDKPINLNSFQKILLDKDFYQISIKLIHNFYNEKTFDFLKVLAIIDEIRKKYPIIELKAQFLQIYQRAASINSKFFLDLPIRNIFPLAGLYFEQSNVLKLFKFILPQIIEVINESNIFKIVKLMSLSFRTAQVQASIYEKYLEVLIYKKCNTINKIQNNVQNKQLNQIIVKIINNIKPEIILNKMLKLFYNIHPSLNKNQLLDCIAQVTIKRLGQAQKKMLLSRIQSIKSKNIKNY